MSPVVRAVAENFNRAAPNYDESASVQAQVADRLVARAAESVSSPQNILDLGCGTGFVAQAARRVWPHADITGVDASPAMLRQTQSKIPDLKIVSGDAGKYQPAEKFDLIFSSMMLQWLPQPRVLLERWRSWLKPQGRMYIAIPVEGSLQEWRNACHRAGVEDGLWPLPSPSFADDLAYSQSIQTIQTTYPTAADFLKRLKAIGAATPHPNHKVLNSGAMRRVLAHTPVPFGVTYRILTMQLFPQDAG